MKKEREVNRPVRVPSYLVQPRGSPDWPVPLSDASMRTKALKIHAAELPKDHRSMTLLFFAESGDFIKKKQEEQKTIPTLLLLCISLCHFVRTFLFLNLLPIISSPPVSSSKVNKIILHIPVLCESILLAIPVGIHDRDIFFSHHSIGIGRIKLICCTLMPSILGVSSVTRLCFESVQCSG